MFVLPHSLLVVAPSGPTLGLRRSPIQFLVKLHRQFSSGPRTVRLPRLHTLGFQEIKVAPSVVDGDGYVCCNYATGDAADFCPLGKVPRLLVPRGLLRRFRQARGAHHPLPRSGFGDATQSCRARMSRRMTRRRKCDGHAKELRVDGGVIRAHYRRGAW